MRWRGERGEREEWEERERRVPLCIHYADFDGE